MSETADSDLFSGAPLVKICGITNLADALVAAEAGADYLGFIFYAASKRATNPDDVRQIVRELRGRPETPLLVAVFVNETASHMAHVLDSCGMDLAQLHGDETPNLIEDPDSPIYGRSYKALRPASFAEAEAEMEWYLPTKTLPGQPSLLIDARHASLYGGSGQTADWTMAARLARTVPKLMLAGGLNHDNVAEAFRQVQPYAVDVASGVESAPGRKDHFLVRSFIANARSVKKGIDNAGQ